MLPNTSESDLLHNSGVVDPIKIKQGIDRWLNKVADIGTSPTVNKANKNLVPQELVDAAEGMKVLINKMTPAVQTTLNKRSNLLSRAANLPGLQQTAMMGAALATGNAAAIYAIGTAVLSLGTYSWLISSPNGLAFLAKLGKSKLSSKEVEAALAKLISSLAAQKKEPDQDRRQELLDSIQPQEQTNGSN